MLPPQENTACQISSAHIVNSLANISQLNHPACPAVIWQRPIETKLQSWLDNLTPEELTNTRILISPKDMRKTLEEACNASGATDCPERQMLIDDVVELADEFAQLMSTPYLRLRLDKVATNACKKFHVDYLTARLVCTYRGTGTEYGIASDGTEPQSIYNVPTGSPLLIRGKHWPNNPTSKFLHRSPPIEGTGETRLVLVLDPVSEIFEENKVR